MLRPRNWLYHSYILTDLKKETLGEGGELSDEEREIVRAARSVRDYDDRFISPRYGFRGADDYYELCTPLDFMPEIRVPTLVLAACDDPWIPVGYYRDFKWSDNPSLLPVMAEGGGHVGFHRPTATGRGATRCWRNSWSGSDRLRGVSLRPDLPPFQPRFPWWTGDLQTLANRSARQPTRSRRTPANG